MKISKIIIFAIVVGGFVLRLLPIEWGLPSKNLALSSYSPDEQVSFHSLEQMNPKKLDFYPHQALDWGSLHIYLLGMTVKTAEILGAVKIGNREYYLHNLKELDKLYMLGRLVPIIAGTISIWLLYLIILNLFSDAATALLGSLLLAVIPVHLVYSFYVRPDALMILFGLCVIYFALRILETGARKYYLICGAFAGLTISAKYSGGACIVLPIVAHLLYLYRAKELTFGKILGRNLQFGLLALLGAFIITCPYCVTPVFPSHIRHLLSQAKGAPYNQPGWIAYLTYLLPTGMGWPLFLSSVAGCVGLAAAWRRDRDPKKIFLVFAGLGVYGIISSPKCPITVYVMPVIPFLVIYSAYFLRTLWNAENKIVKQAGRLAVIFVVSYTTVYSLAYLNLFLEKNVREDASEWIEKNIPLGSSVAIARSYFWTPPILRRYDPPYKVLMGGDINSFLPDAVLGLGKVCEKADYLVLSEYEYREFVHPEIKEYFPEHSAIIDNIFSEKKFQKIAEFDREASFLGLTFKKNYPPTDWLFPNPKIIVFKRKE